jgi:hypothetical protein
MPEPLASVIDSYGELRTLPQSLVKKATDEGTIQRIATPEEIAAYDIKKKYGGTGQTVRAGAEALARGATLGLSDIALSQTGLATPQDIAGRQAASPVVTGAGEAVGMIAPALFPAGGTEAVGTELAARATAAGLAKAAARTAIGASPAALLARAGRAAEGATTGLLGGKAIGRIAGSAVGAAAEGAIGVGAMETAESILQDKDLSAEKLMVAMGSGALLGAGMGAGMRGIGEIAGKGLRVAGEHISLGNLQRISNEQAFMAAGEGQIGMRQLEKARRSMGENYKAQLGERFKEEGFLKGIPDAEKFHERALAAMKKRGEEIGGVIDEMDTVADELKPDRRTLAVKLREGVTAPLENSPFPEMQELGKSLANKSLAPFMAAGEQLQYGTERWTFKELHSLRRQLDSRINWDKGAIDPKTQYLKEARNIIEDYIEETADQAAERMGDKFKQTYTAAKKKYQAASIGEELSRKRMTVNQTQQSLGIEPFVTGAIGAAMTGNVMGAALGFGASRVQQQLTGLMKKYGSSAVALGLDNLAPKISRITQRINGAVDSVFSARNISPAIASSQPSPAGADIEKAFEEKSKFYEALNDRQAIENRLKDTVPEELLPQVTGIAARSVEYIKANQPKIPQRSNDIFSSVDKGSKLSDREMLRWLRQVAAAEHPEQIMSAITQGSLTDEQMDALHSIYPRIHQEISARMLQKATEVSSRPPTDRTNMMSKILGSSVDPYTSNRFLSAVQQSHTQVKRATTSVAKMQATKSDSIGNMMSASQKLESKRS